METIVKGYEEYLETLSKTLTDEMESLKAADREDEAIHKKIERNVVEIFTTLFNVSKKQAGGSAERLESAYLKFLENIPKEWYAKLEQAKTHGDEENVHIETIKIQLKDTLKDKFLELR